MSVVVRPVVTFWFMLEMITRESEKIISSQRDIRPKDLIHPEEEEEDKYVPFILLTCKLYECPTMRHIFYFL